MFFKKENRRGRYRVMNVLLNEIVSKAESEGRTYLMEHECKELLAGEGIPTTVISVAHSAVEAIEIPISAE